MSLSIRMPKWSSRALEIGVGIETLFLLLMALVAYESEGLFLIFPEEPLPSEVDKLKASWQLFVLTGVFLMATVGLHLAVDSSPLGWATFAVVISLVNVVFLNGLAIAVAGNAFLRHEGPVEDIFSVFVAAIAALIALGTLFFGLRLTSARRGLNS